MSGTLMLLAVTWALAGPDADQAPPVSDGDLRVTECLVTLIDDVEISAQEAGRIKQLEAKKGSEVSPDAELGCVEDTQAQLQLDAAEFEYQVARKEADSDVNLRYAQASVGVAAAAYDMARTANAAADRAVPKALLQQRRFELTRAELSVDQNERDTVVNKLKADAKRVARDLAQDQVDRRKIRSLISGRVVDVLKKVGEWVDAGEPILQVVRLDHLYVQGMVSAHDYRPSQIESRAVTVDVELERGRTIQVQGRITFASPKIESGGSYQIFAEVANPREGEHWLLGAGMPATMTIHLGPTTADHAPTADIPPAAEPPAKSAAANGAGPALTTGPTKPRR